ncbi:MAG: hypothetical protein K2K63_10575 [Acetatifactor sp.]|nr:hypothetical protein [Acetatifactor sp.]
MMTYCFHDDSTLESSLVFSPFESRLTYMMDMSMVKKYQEDQYYEVYLDEEGQPVEVTKYKSYDRNGSVIAESLAARTEDVENLRQLIDAASLLSNSNGNDLYLIASEEIGIYLSGQRSAEETIGIIQNRVQLYLDENK